MRDVRPKQSTTTGKTVNPRKGIKVRTPNRRYTGRGHAAARPNKSTRNERNRMSDNQRARGIKAGCNTTPATQGDLYLTEERLHRRLDELQEEISILAAAMVKLTDADGKLMQVLAHIASRAPSFASGSENNTPAQRHAREQWHKTPEAKRDN